MKKWISIYSVIILLPIFGFAFNMGVTPSAETCAGNGTLTFNITNANPAGTIQFVVYKLPNTTNPYATLTANFLDGLSAGNYRVIATETVGSTSTTQQQDAMVNNNLVPFDYTIQNINQACASSSNISITVTSGTAVSYAIISGPMTFPPQSSNTFSGLPQGTYGIRVFDSCGKALVKTHTVVLNPAGILIGPTVLTDTSPPSCNFKVATNIVTPATGTVIGYPLTIQYTVNPPTGSPIVTNQTLGSGDPSSQPISETIPYYPNQNYSYDISITDACGINTVNNFPVQQSISISPTINALSCNRAFLTLTASNFTPPYTLNFTNAPAGFNPSSFNAAYPGPYTAPDTVFGDNANPIPFGLYEVSITDVCGNTLPAPVSFNYVSNPPVPQITATHNGCTTTTERIAINIPNYIIATAIVTAAPATYPFTLPHDVTSSIDVSGVLVLDPVPLGNYSFTITDTCGDNLPTLTANEPVYTDQGLITELQPGCALQESSIRIASNNGSLTSIIITAAPAGFPQALPYNASTNIASGVFYMAGLAPGNYTFNAIDICNYNNSVTVNVVGYNISSQSFSLQQNCGSFNIPLNFVSNGNMNESFWLQKLLDPVANIYGNPSAPSSFTPADVYTANTVPNPSNSLQLANNANNLNLSFNGTFRIQRYFSSYNNGSDLNNLTVSSIIKDCHETLSPTLSFNEVLEIKEGYRMFCSANGTPDVYIDALGTAPLHYTIVSKDGSPFFLDNFNSNIFSNLAPGLYIFNVEDPCGNIQPHNFNVASLNSLVNINRPADMIQCVNAVTGNETYDLTLQSPVILGAQSPANYTLTYYTSQPDAQSATNPITNLNAFDPASNPQTIYARLIFNQVPNCYDLTSFDLYAGINPQLNLQPTYLECTMSPIAIDATGTNLPTTTYLWQDGSTNPVITVTQPGVNNLTVIATNAYGSTATCTATQNITVTISEPPKIDHIETTDWSADENTITVVSSNPSAFEYSLDNVNFQVENTFGNLAPGLYTVYIRDKNGCGTITQMVWLLNYPKFFTPNDDGFNDRWFIKNQNNEPDFLVYIYDRYGKLIKSFTSSEPGWDGTLNGKPLFADDYWFVVHRQDGRIQKGHFALKR